jgi:hypothetical protein
MIQLDQTFHPRTPQIRLTWARYNFPRTEAYPHRHYRVTRRERRRRISENESRARDHLPAKTYRDYRYAQLQRRRGTFGVRGYMRYRRVYRVRSKNNR